MVAEAIRAVPDQELKKKAAVAAVQATSDNEALIKDVANATATAVPDLVKKNVVASAVRHASD